MIVDFKQNLEITIKDTIKEIFNTYGTSHMVFFKFFNYSKEKDTWKLLAQFEEKIKPEFPLEIRYKVNTVNDNFDEAILMIIIPANIYPSLEMNGNYEGKRLPPFTNLVFKNWKKVHKENHMDTEKGFIYDVNYNSYMYIKSPLEDEGYLNFLTRAVTNNFLNVTASNYTVNVADTILSGIDKFDSVNIYHFNVKTPFNTECDINLLSHLKRDLKKAFPCTCFIYKAITSDTGEFELLLTVPSKFITNYTQPFTIGVKEFRPVDILIFKTWLTILADNGMLSESKRETKFILSSIKYNNILSNEVLEFLNITSELRATELRTLLTELNHEIKNKRLGRY